MKNSTIISTILRSKIFSYLADIALFIVITIVIHKLWWAYDGYIHSVAVFNFLQNFLADLLFNISSWIDIHILRMDITLRPGNTILFNGIGSFYIDYSCSGFKQMFQVLILFLLMPGPWKQKLWFIPAGMVSMILINVIRIIGLSYAMLWFPQHWDFIHMWIMRPLFYVWIFFLWVIWVEKVRRRPLFFRNVVTT